MFIITIISLSAMIGIVSAVIVSTEATNAEIRNLKGEDYESQKRMGRL